MVLPKRRNVGVGVDMVCDRSNRLEELCAGWAFRTGMLDMGAGIDELRSRAVRDPALGDLWIMVFAGGAHCVMLITN